MKKYNTNTILLGIIAISLAFLVLHKIYEEIMIYRITNKINQELNKFNTAQEELYKEQDKTLEHIENMKKIITNTGKEFNNTMQKISNVPQIKMPKINQTNQIINEEQKPHESSERKKIIIEVK